MNQISPFFNLENASFSSIANDADMDKSQSSISQYSCDNRGFSIKDICPDASLSYESKHSRVASQQIDCLAPPNLFTHSRKPSKPPFHSRKSSLLNHESEELNSTRMQTCQSRRISDFELGITPVRMGETHEIVLEKAEDEKFCGNCRKNVKGKIGYPEDSAVDSFIIQIVNLLFYCCSTQCLGQLRVETCEECGFAL
jgi:hypothetical protein